MADLKGSDNSDGYYVGIDAGSVSLNCTAINAHGQVVYEFPYKRHFGRIEETLISCLYSLYRELGEDNVRCVSFTGNHGRNISQRLKAFYEFETISQVTGTLLLRPDTRTIISMGGQDTSLMQIDPGDGKWKLEYFNTNGPCASGTGLFIDQQAAHPSYTYDILHGKVKTFVSEYLFDKPVEIDNLNTLRNLSETVATRTVIETFKKNINELTLQDKGNAEIRDRIKLRQTRPFVVKEQGYLVPSKSLFNKIIGDSRLELEFAAFLEKCPDVVSYAKNYMAVHFSIDYVKADGNISNYYPDFLVKLDNGVIVIVETKGQEDLDVPLKMARLATWCKDINLAQSETGYDFVFVDEDDFTKYQLKSFEDLLKGFTKYKTEAPGHLEP